MKLALVFLLAFAATSYQQRYPDFIDQQQPAWWPSGRSGLIQHRGFEDEDVTAEFDYNDEQQQHSILGYSQVRAFALKTNFII